MFTGLIEEIGFLRAVSRQGEAMVLTVGASRVLSDAKNGDSIAVNGVCLTVIRIGGGEIAFDVTPQTYRHTNLSRLAIGGRVNLERAMAAGGRFGGHIVQGHVDTFGTIVGKQTDQNAVVYAIEPDDPGVMRYVVPQGSIALDGISLTVAGVERSIVKVSIIPHTLAETALRDKGPGDTVNIECDILGKYVEHLLGFRTPAGKSGALTAEKLAEHGFL